MSLTEQVNQGIKEAMKAKDQVKLASLRAVKSALLLAATEKGGGASGEDAEIKMLQKLVKQRKEAAEIYQQQGRDEQAEEELAQAAVIEAFLPEQMSEEELKKVLQEIIQQVGAAAPSDMGKVMGVATKQLSGKAEGKEISRLVRALLAN